MKKKYPEKLRLYLGEGMTTHRIQTLVDGIYAIAMTSLVLNISIPRQTAGSLSMTTFNHLLLNLWLKFWTFGLSFLLLAIFWSTNHRLFRLIKHANPRLLWINLFCLMFVALVPFSTSLIGEYGQYWAAQMFFDLNLFVIGSFSYLNWQYAAKYDLLHESVDSKTIVFAKNRNLVFPVISLVACGLCFITPLWSNLYPYPIYSYDDE
jgi:uncharacterized membrane protein